MARLPFDPDRVAGGEAAKSGGGSRARKATGKKRYAHAAEAKQLTVTQAASLIKSTLETHITSPIRVVGEVSNLNCRNHWYFSLKDDKSVLSCVAWASAVKKFGFTPNDGDEVVATGEISHYGPQGKTQLYVRKLEPIGAGALELRFRAMCEKLRAQGYFDPAHKIEPPVFPRRIAVITAAGGAAVHDVIDTAKHRCRAVALLVVNVKVQGDGAAEQVARAIRWVDEHHERLGVDAILVTRGGGSMEDLWAFNEQVVADATYACRTPIVAAIGHESDTTVIELVADVRAATPTQAAMRLVPDARQMHQQVDHYEGRLNLLTRQLVDRGRRHVAMLTRSPVFTRPASLIGPQRQRVVELSRHLRHASTSRVTNARLHVERLAGRLGSGRDETVLTARRQRLTVLVDRLARACRHVVNRRKDLDQYAGRLERAVLGYVRHTGRHLEQLDRRLAAVDPYRVLARGYTLTRAADGRLLQSATETRPGQVVVTQFHDGDVRSTVEEDREHSAAAGSAQTGRGHSPTHRARQPTTAKERARSADQMDLFG